MRAACTTEKEPVSKKRKRKWAKVALAYTWEAQANGSLGDLDKPGLYIELQASHGHIRKSTYVLGGGGTRL